MQFAKDDIETLAAITKQASPPQQSPTTPPKCFLESGTDRRPSGSNSTILNRALEDGDLATSPVLRSSQELLLGKTRSSRWYVPSSSMSLEVGVGSDETHVGDIAQVPNTSTIIEGEESLTSKVKRSLLYSCGGRQHTNLSMDSIVNTNEDREMPKLARRICSIERISETYV